MQNAREGIWTYVWVIPILGSDIVGLFGDGQVLGKKYSQCSSLITVYHIFASPVESLQDLTGQEQSEDIGSRT